MSKSKTITIAEAVDKYYKRNKAKLDSIFGSERAAKSQLKNMPGIPATRFNDQKNATKAFNSFIDEIIDPIGHDLRAAKKEAMENTPGVFKKVQELNKRIDKTGYKSHSKYIGVIDGKHVSIEGYYDIKNSDNVLAYVRYTSSKSTEIYAWEFVDRSLL